jgi:Integrase core domain
VAPPTAYLAFGATDLPFAIELRRAARTPAPTTMRVAGPRRLAPPPEERSRRPTGARSSREDRCPLTGISAVRTLGDHLSLYLEILLAVDTQSLSRPRQVWDNAVVEAFYSTLKTELVQRYVWATRTQARQAIFDFVEVFYNRQRLHSTLGYVSPAEYEGCLAAAAAHAA